MFTSGPTKGEILLLEGKVFQFCSRQQPSMGANFDLKRYKYVISVSYDLRQ